MTLAFFTPPEAIISACSNLSSADYIPGRADN